MKTGILQTRSFFQHFAEYTPVIAYIYYLIVIDAFTITKWVWF